MTQRAPKRITVMIHTEDASASRSWRLPVWVFRAAVGGAIVLGLALLSYATNLLIFVSGRLMIAAPPIVAEDAQLTDPLPQALVLTAIVISFGVLAFALALVRRAYEVLGTDDLEQMRRAEP